MTNQLQRIGRKDHAPGKVWVGHLTAIQFAANKVTNPAKHQPCRYAGCDKIQGLEPGHLIFLAPPQHGQNDTEETTVEAHTTGPDLEQPQRICQELRKAIEQDITDTATDDDTKRTEENQVRDHIWRPATLFGTKRCQSPGK